LAFANLLKAGVANLGWGFFDYSSDRLANVVKKLCSKMIGLVLSHESGPSTTFGPRGSTIAAFLENLQAVYQRF
jgi:hypothetical protein